MAVADTNLLAPLLPLLVLSDTVGERGLMALMCCVCYTSHDAGLCHEACMYRVLETGFCEASE